VLETKLVRCFGDAPLATLHYIVASPVRHMTGKSEAIRYFLKTLNLSVVVRF
jgi:hypothetical protein